MRLSRSFLLTSTILSVAGVTGSVGVVAVSAARVSAAPISGEMVAQTTPSNQDDQHKREQEKKPPQHPAPPPPHQPPPPPPPHEERHQPPPPSPPPLQNEERRHKHAPPSPPPLQNEERRHEHAPPSPPPPQNEERRHDHAPPPPPPPPTNQPQPNAAVPPPPANGPHPPNGQGAGNPPNQNVRTAPPGGAQPQPPLNVQRAAPPAGNPAAVPPPTQAIGKQQFLAPKGQAPSAGLDQLRRERHEERQGNQTIIREPGRTIVEQGDHSFIRHNEDDRFAVDARNVHVERRGNQTVTIIMRPDGVQIVDFDDDSGRLLRRVRRDPSGREIVIIDNGFAGARPDALFLDLPQPVIRIPRERYILDADSADEAAIYGVLDAPPVERLDARYTLDQVLYNQPLRALMPRIDLDINFDTGSWQLTPDQVDRLSIVADALNRAVRRNQREVFLIEGHTDAVGSDIDNLSLSDRRAESVAVALTEQFQVPAENLVTQGYGKQDLKVLTSGPERANRRVTIRRITPLIDPSARN